MLTSGSSSGGLVFTEELDTSNISEEMGGERKRRKEKRGERKGEGEVGRDGGGKREKEKERSYIVLSVFWTPYLNSFIHTCIYLEAGSHYVTQASLKLTTLPQPPTCGDCEPICHT